MNVQEELNDLAVLVCSRLSASFASKLIADIKKGCTTPGIRAVKIKYALAERLCGEYIHPADAVMWNSHRADPTLTNIIQDLRVLLLKQIEEDNYTKDVCFIPLSDLVRSVYRVESMDIGADKYPKKERDIYQHNFYWNIGLRLVEVLTDPTNYDVPKN